MIELNHALVVYMIVVIILIIIFVRLSINTNSALVLSFFIGLIVLDIMCPPSIIDTLDAKNGSAGAIYLVIQILTVFMVAIYTFVSAWKDKKVSK